MRVAFQRGDRTPHLGAYRERARRPGRSRRIVESMFFDFSEDALRPDFTAVEVHHLIVHRVAVGGSGRDVVLVVPPRSEEHTSELQSLMRISYAVFCLKKKNNK